MAATSGAWFQKKKIFRRKRYSLAASRRDTLCPIAVRTLSFPSPILSPSLFPFSGRYVRGMASELRALQQPGLEY
eukprot:scaffold14373_cov149-Isochrysis_galbana.AAC.2